MKRKLSVLGVLVVALVLTAFVHAQGLPSPTSGPVPTPTIVYDHLVYLPLVRGGGGMPAVTPTPTQVPAETSTPTPTPTPTSMPSLTPTPSPTPTDTPTPTPTSTPTPQPVYELLNGDFENGPDGSWTTYYENPLRPNPCIVSTYLQLWGIPYIEGYGSWLGWLGGADADPPPWEIVTAIEQLVTIPTDAVLCFEYQTYSEAWWGNGGDTASLSFDNTVLVTWDIDSSADNGNWAEMCIDLEGWQGETVILRFEMVNNFIWRGDLYIDNVEFTEQPSATPTGTPTPTLTPTPTVSLTATPTSTPTSTPDPRGVFVLPNTTVYMDTHWHCRVVGEIQNDTLGSVEEVHFAVYTLQGGVLQLTNSDRLDYWTILPGGRACFRVWTGENSCVGGGEPDPVVVEVTSYEIGDNDRVLDFTFDTFYAWRDQSNPNILHVSFRAHNNEPVPVETVSWRGSLYDDSNNLLDCNTTNTAWAGNFDVGEWKALRGSYCLSHYDENIVAFRWFSANGNLLPGTLTPTPTPRPTRTPTPAITIVP